MSARKSRIADLRVSTSREDRVTAVLMNTSIEGRVLLEPSARKKAVEVLRVLDQINGREEPS